jgi:hypothetical protein
MEPEVLLPHSQESATLPYREPDEWSPHSQPISGRPLIIISCYLRVGPPSGLSPSGFPAKTLYSLISHACYMPCKSHPPWLHHSNCIWRRVQVMELLILRFSLTSYYFTLLRSTYSHNLKNGRCENLNLKMNWLQSTDEGTSLDGHAGVLHLPTIYFYEICVFFYRSVTIHNFNIAIE